MGRPRRRATLLLVLAAGWCVGGAALAAPSAGAATRGAPETPKLTLVVLPYEEARALVEGRRGAVALGVSARSRGGADFVEAIGRRGALARSLADRGLEVRIAASPAAPPDVTTALEHALGASRVPSIEEALRRPVAGLVVGRAEEAAGALRGARRALVIGVRARTPLLVVDPARDGLLRRRYRPRPGVATPSDVRAAVLEAAAGVPPRALETVAHADPLGWAERVGARFERDDSTRRALATGLAGLLYGPLIAAALARRAGMRSIAVRLASASAWTPAGYVGALFLPTGHAWLRLLPLAGAALAGAAIPPSRARRTAGAILLAVAASIGALAIVAVLRPTEEPALGLWGSSLEITRLWGLSNGPSTVMFGGLVAGAGLARIPIRALGAAAAAILAISAGPRVGENLVSAAWIPFGATVAIALRREGRLRAAVLLRGAVLGVVAFAAALTLAWAASPASHGALTVRRFQAGGVPEIVEVARERLALNVGEFRDLPVWYPAWTAALLAGLVLVAVAAMRRPERLAPTRPMLSAVVGCATTALVVLLIEDTGVVVAPLLAALAAACYLLARAPAEAAPPDGISRGGPSRPAP